MKQCVLTELLILLTCIAQTTTAREESSLASRRHYPATFVPQSNIDEHIDAALVRREPGNCIGRCRPPSNGGRASSSSSHSSSPRSGSPHSGSSDGGSAHGPGSSSLSRQNSNSEQHRNLQTTPPRTSGNAVAPGTPLAESPRSSSSSSGASEDIRNLLRGPPSHSPSPGSSEASSPRSSGGMKPTIGATMTGPGWITATKGRARKRDWERESYHRVAPGQTRTKTFSHPKKVTVRMTSMYAGKNKPEARQMGFASGNTVSSEIQSSRITKSEPAGRGGITSFSQDHGRKVVTTNEEAFWLVGTATKSTRGPAGASLTYHGQGMTKLTASNASPDKAGRTEFGPPGRPVNIIPGPNGSRELGTTRRS